MCLFKKEDFTLTKEGEYYVGWKTFYERRNDKDREIVLYSSSSGDRDKLYPTNKWLQEKDYRENKFFSRLFGWLFYGHGFKLYRKGFHIYANQDCGTRKVYFRKVVAKGSQLISGDVVVAKEIMIPEE